MYIVGYQMDLKKGPIHSKLNCTV